MEKDSEKMDQKFETVATKPVAGKNDAREQKQSQKSKIDSLSPEQSGKSSQSYSHSYKDEDFQGIEEMEEDSEGWQTNVAKEDVENPRDQRI